MPVRGIPAATVITAALIAGACGGKTQRDFSGSGSVDPSGTAGSTGSVVDATVGGTPNSGGGGGGTPASAGQPGAGGAVGSGPCLSYAISEPVFFGDPKTDSVVSWIGDAYAIVWAENQETDFAREWYRIEYLSVDRAGQILHRETPYSFRELDENALVRDVGTATLVAAAAAGDGLGVLWHRAVNTGDEELVFARLTTSGTGVTAPSALAPEDWRGLTRLIWNGSRFGATWECGNGLCFAQLDDSGRLVDTVLDTATSGFIVALYLFWDRDSYALAWEESLPVLQEVRSLTVSPAASQAGESLLLSDPDRYAQGLFVNQLREGYSAVWGEVTKRDPVETRLLMAELDRTGNVVGEPRQLVDAPIAALQFNGHEYGAILSHYTTIETRTPSYSFVTMSQDGNWQAEEIPLIPADTFAQVVSFDWNGTGFGLFWKQPEGDERRLGYLQIRCQR